MPRPSRLGLIVAALAFVAWLGYLGYLAATASRPVVISRPQVLISTVVVVARVEQAGGKPAPDVTVVAVPRPEEDEPGQAEAWKGKTLTVRNLPDTHGWRGPGEYILPLEYNRKTEDYEVVDLTSRSPGYDPSKNRPLIYPSTEATLRQLAGIPRPEIPRPID